MKYITLKQFIYTVNIRDYFKDKLGREIYGNKIIRLISANDNGWKDNDFLDISWYDFGCKNESWNILKKYLNDEILNSYVVDFYYNDLYNVLNVYLDCNPDEDLVEFKN